MILPKSTHKNLILTCCISMQLSNPLWAIEAAAIPIGEAALYPSLNIISGFDDNILATEQNEESSWVTRINPNFLFEAEKENILAQLNYSLEKGIIHSSSEDNYFDQNLTGTLNILANRKNRFDLQTSIAQGHEARGDEDGGAVTQTTAPLEYSLKSVQGIYTFGGLKAKGNIELSGGYKDKKFTNFRDITQTRDFDQVDLGAAFKYRVSDRTSANAKIIRYELDYDHSNKDNTNTRYLLGAAWDATAKTSGFIDIGWSEKDFDDSTIEDTNGGTWDISINWKPKTYSTFIFNSGQEFGESTADSSYINTKNYGINWDHYWKEHIKTTLSYNKTSEDYGNSDRKDTTDTYTFGVNFETKRWLNMGLGYTIIDRKSNFNDRSFEKNTLLLTVQMSL
jgi:hypothetical protein